MKIDTVRLEEARVKYSRAGFHRFKTDLGHEYGSFEVLWIEETKRDYDGFNSMDALASGWYWQPGFPGCYPDGPAIGPFASSNQAYDDAQNNQ